MTGNRSDSTGNTVTPPYISRGEGARVAPRGVQLQRPVGRTGVGQETIRPVPRSVTVTPRRRDAAA